MISDFLKTILSYMQICQQLFGTSCAQTDTLTDRQTDKIPVIA